MLSPGTRGGFFFFGGGLRPDHKHAPTLKPGVRGARQKLTLVFFGGCSKRDGDGDAGDGGVMAMVIMSITTMTNMPDRSHPRRHTHAHTH